MKLLTPDHSGNLALGQPFKIEMDAHIFNMLLTSLYNDAPLAVVRETMINAWDAHVVAGMVNTPIKIELPSSLGGEFVVHDFGEGMSSKVFDDIYMSIGKSDGKKESNDTTGGFGRGAKVPLAVVPSYRVVSTHEGVTIEYRVYKDCEGIPRGIKVPTTVSDRPNGTSVYIPTTDDFTLSHINRALDKLTDSFPCHIDGNPFKPRARVQEGTGWRLLEKTDFISRQWITLLVGGIPYPLPDGYDDECNNLLVKIRNLINYDIYIQMPNGDTVVGDSREYIKGIPHNMTILKLRLEAVLDEIESKKAEVEAGISNYGEWIPLKQGTHPIQLDYYQESQFNTVQYKGSSKAGYMQLLGVVHFWTMEGVKRSPHNYPFENHEIYIATRKDIRRMRTVAARTHKQTPLLMVVDASIWDDLHQLKAWFSEMGLKVGVLADEAVTTPPAGDKPAPRNLDNISGGGLTLDMYNYNCLVIRSWDRFNETLPLGSTIILVEKSDDRGVGKLRRDQIKIRDSLKLVGVGGVVIASKMVRKRLEADYEVISLDTFEQMINESLTEMGLTPTEVPIEIAAQLFCEMKGKHQLKLAKWIGTTYNVGIVSLHGALELSGRFEGAINALESQLDDMELIIPPTVKQLIAGIPMGKNNAYAILDIIKKLESKT